MSRKFIDIVFDGPPERPMPHFVEIEDENGHCITPGEWVYRNDGSWALRIQTTRSSARPTMSTMGSGDAIEKARELGMNDAEAEYNGRRKGQRSLSGVVEAIGGQGDAWLSEIRDAYAHGWCDFW